MMRSLLHRINKTAYRHQLAVAIFLFVTSFILLVILYPEFSLLRSIPIGVNWIAVVMLFDYLNRKFNNYTISPTTAKRKSTLLKLAVVAALFNLAFDVLGSWTTRLWYYPQYDYRYYILVFAPIGYAVYGLGLYSIFVFFKKLFDDEVRGGRLSDRRTRMYEKVMAAEIALGLLGIWYSLYYLLDHISNFKVPVFNIQLDSNLPVEWWFTFMSGFSLLFIFEYISFKQGKETLTRDLIRGNFVPLVALLCCSAVGMIFIEAVNYPFQIWTFANWPLQEVAIVGVPIVAVIVWPLQFLVLMSMMRCFFDARKLDIW